MWRTLALLTGVALAAGCDGGKRAGEFPKTYPVTGRVVDAKGHPLKGGTVQFETGEPADTTVVGVIGPDGTFAVKTFRDKSEADGAPAGEYRVTVLPPLGADNAAPEPIVLSKPVQVEEGEKTLEIDLRKK